MLLFGSGSSLIDQSGQETYNMSCIVIWARGLEKGEIMPFAGLICQKCNVFEMTEAKNFISLMDRRADFLYTL